MVGSSTWTALAVAPIITFVIPPLGANVDIPGSIVGLPGAAKDFRLGILVSGDGGFTWYDKTHDYPDGKFHGVPLLMCCGRFFSSECPTSRSATPDYR